MATTTGKEYKLAIRIAGSVDKTFTSTMTSAKSTLSTLSTAFGTVNTGADKMINAAKATATYIATALTVAATAISVAAKEVIQAGMGNEDAFAGVKKTVKATEEEYAELDAQLWSMSESLPITYKELASVMETAGQLGVETNSVASFTEVMAKLGLVSNDMDANSAAETFAKFANIVQMSDFGEDGVSNWERLGSTVLTLGNNFATTEGTISEMALALGAQAKMVGFTEDQILAYATAMASVGMSPAIGGNNMSKILSEIQLAVETNSDTLTDWAAVAGMTAEEFAAAFSEDAAGTMFTWIKGLSEGEESATAILDSLGITEMRSTKMLKGLTQDSEGLGEALEVASEAWNANTGLDEYSESKLSTLSSQLTETENSLDHIKTTIYDELKPYLEDFMSWAQEKLGEINDFLGGDSGITSAIDTIIENFPTWKREAETYLSPIADIISGIFSFISNETVVKLVIANIAGIATAIAGIKIGNTVVKGLSSLQTFIQGIGSGSAVSTIQLIAIAVTAIVTAVTYLSELEADKIADNLAEHFGNIALSMGELEEIASYILASDSLEGVKQALDAFGDLSPISSSIESFTKELNKTNWKVRLGIELTPEEQESYVSTIESFVTAANEYAKNYQVAVAMVIDNMLDGNEEDQEKINTVTGMMTTTMETLGTELSRMVNEAFADGLLNDPETMTAIAEKQAQLTELQNLMTEGKSNAVYSRIVSGTDGLSELDANTFQNLQNEINNQLEADLASYQQAYDDTVGAAYAAWKYAEQYAPGSYTEADYLSAKDTAYNNMLNYKAEETARAAQAQVDAIMNVYGDTVENMGGSVDEVLAQAVALYDSYGEFVNSGLYEQASTMITSAAGSDSGALGTLYNNMSDTLTQLYTLKTQFETAGLEVPDSITTAIENIEAIGADELNIDSIITEEAFDAAKAAAETGAQGISDNVINTIASDENIATAEAEADTLLTAIGNELNTTIDATVTAAVTILSGTINTTQLEWAVKNKISSLSTSAIDNNAEGGIIMSKELSWVGENGPEAIIPLDGSRSAQMLYEQTGRLLGASSRFANTDLSDTGGAQITYSPVLNFNSGTPTQQDIVDALAISQDEFDSMMESYMRRRARVAF